MFNMDLKKYNNLTKEQKDASVKLTEAWNLMELVYKQYEHDSDISSMLIDAQRLTAKAEGLILEGEDTIKKPSHHIGRYE